MIIFYQVDQNVNAEEFRVFLRKMSPTVITDDPLRNLTVLLQALSFVLSRLIRQANSGSTVATTKISSELDSILLEFSSVDINRVGIVELWADLEREFALKERILALKSVIAGGNPELNKLVLKAIQKYVSCLSLLELDVAQV